MTINIKNKITPKLRFPGFFGEWEEKNLGEICDYKNGGAFENNLVDNGKYNLVTLNSIDISGRLKKNHKTVGHAEWYLKKYDLIMVLSDVAHGNFLGLVDIIPEDNRYVLNQRMGLLRKIDNHIDLNFLRTYINKNQRYFKLHGQGSSQQNLSKGDVLKFKIPAPSLPEQQKIAEFLGSLDEWIENLRVQKESWEKYKKGMTQKIFSQKVRFKDIDGKDFAEWEEKRLGNVCDIKKGKQLNRIGLSASEGHPVINGGIAPSGYTDTFNTKGNTIAISEGGNSCGFVNFIKKDFWCGGHCYSLLNIPSDTTVLFLYQYLKLFEKKIMRLRVGSGLPNIQRKDIEKLKLKLPSLFEQQKITEFLSSIDNSIESKQQQVTRAEQWKKGLMQGLFV